MLQEMFQRFDKNSLGLNSTAHLQSIPLVGWRVSELESRLRDLREFVVGLLLSLAAQTLWSFSV